MKNPIAALAPVSFNSRITGMRFQRKRPTGRLRFSDSRNPLVVNASSGACMQACNCSMGNAAQHGQPPTTHRTRHPYGLKSCKSNDFNDCVKDCVEHELGQDFDEYKKRL